VPPNKVTVTFAGRTLGTINLHRSKPPAWSWLPAVTAKTGTPILNAGTTAPVLLDGILLRR
jgi:hypothetical protein